MPLSSVRLTETELRQVLLVQALEAQAGPPDGAPWTAEESRQASAAATAQLVSDAGATAGAGRSAGPGAGTGADTDSDPVAAAFLVARARWVLHRLSGAAPALRGFMAGAAAGGVGGPQEPAGQRGWWALWPLLAFALGLAGDALSSGDRIQLLALPLLGLLAWNLLVYGALVLRWLARLARRRRPAAGLASAGASAGLHPLMGWAAGAAQGAWLRVAAAGQPPWLARALRQQAQSAAPWLAPTLRLRALAALHAAAAALALGAVASMYLRGLALDYRAGWDSTFLQAHQVHALLAVVLSPALPWPGLALPGVAELSALRWTGGGAGAPAAAWIHRLAITLLALVVLPRTLLACAAAWQAGRAALNCTLPLDSPALRRLLRDLPRPAAARAQPVTVLTYSYQLPAASQAGLALAVAEHLGPGAWPEVAAALPLGAEDQLPSGLPAACQGQLLLLMALTATPERETHGALLQRLPGHLPPGSRLQVWLDSSGFVQRLAGQPDAAQRLQQRSQAWQRLVADAGLPPARVLDLAALGAETRS